MKEKTIDEKIKFVADIINATEIKRTQRYFNDIIIYINNLRRNNHKMYEANIHLADELNAIKKESKDNELG